MTSEYAKTEQTVPDRNSLSNRHKASECFKSAALFGGLAAFYAVCAAVTATAIYFGVESNYLNLLTIALGGSASFFGKAATSEYKKGQEHLGLGDVPKGKGKLPDPVAKVGKSKIQPL